MSEQPAQQTQQTQRRRPPRKRPPRLVNKADDKLEMGAAALTGWLGTGFRKPKKPYPWTALAPDDKARFDQATERLVKGTVPRLVAQIMVWGEGDWQRMATMVLEAEEVQIYPERQHIRLVPRRRPVGSSGLYVPSWARDQGRTLPS